MVRSQRLHPVDRNSTVSLHLGVARPWNGISWRGPRECRYAVSPPQLFCSPQHSSTRRGSPSSTLWQLFLEGDPPRWGVRRSQPAGGRCGSAGTAHTLGGDSDGTGAEARAMSAHWMCGRSVSLALYDLRFHSLQDSTHVCGTGISHAAFPRQRHLTCGLHAILGAQTAV